MNISILTSAWDAIILNFSTVFTQPTAAVFIELITGWILCTTRRTITGILLRSTEVELRRMPCIALAKEGILPFADPKGKRCHDAYHRIFPKSRWLPA